MDCRTNCPEVCKRGQEVDGMVTEVSKMEALAAQNDVALEANRKTAKVLANLPNNAETARARTALQEAVVLVSEAQEQTAASIGLLVNAVELNEVATEMMINVCPGAPVEVPDPSQPGRMILACASPVVNE